MRDANEGSWCAPCARGIRRTENQRRLRHRCSHGADNHHPIACPPQEQLSPRIKLAQSADYPCSTLVAEQQHSWHLAFFPCNRGNRPVACGGKSLLTSGRSSTSGDETRMKHG